MPHRPKCKTCESTGSCIHRRTTPTNNNQNKTGSTATPRVPRKKIPGLYTSQVVLEDPELRKWLEWKLDQSGIEYQVINGEYIWTDKPDPILDNYPLTDQETEYLSLLLRVYYLNEEYPYEKLSL